MTDFDETDDDEMTLPEFVAEAVDTLAHFANVWRRNQAAEPDGQVWPQTMRPADWWEQFAQHDPGDDTPLLVTEESSDDE